jgi:hypothetical protein
MNVWLIVNIEVTQLAVTILPADIHLFHPGQGRTGIAPADQGNHILFGTFDNRLNRAVMFISDPSAYAERPCRPLGLGPEANPLNAPTDNQMRPGLFFHGILLSMLFWLSITATRIFPNDLDVKSMESVQPRQGVLNKKAFKNNPEDRGE